MKIVSAVKKNPRKEDDIIVIDNSEPDMGNVLSSGKQQDDEEEEEEFVFGVDESKSDVMGQCGVSSGDAPDNVNTTADADAETRDVVMENGTNEESIPNGDDSATSTVDLSGDTEGNMRVLKEIRGEDRPKGTMADEPDKSPTGNEKKANGKILPSLGKTKESAGSSGAEQSKNSSPKRTANELDEDVNEPNPKRAKVTVPGDSSMAAVTDKVIDPLRKENSNSVKETEPTTTTQEGIGKTRKEATEKADQDSPRAVNKTVDDSTEEDANLSDLEIVQRKWQTASVAHFFAVFKDILPIGNALGEGAIFDTSASTIERAIAIPETDPELPRAMSDMFAVLLVALKRVSMKRAKTHWYEALCTLAGARRAEFLETDGATHIRKWQNDLRFLVEAPWPIRLGALSACIDLVSESDTLRDSIYSRSDSARLQPFGRDSKKRWYYRIGTSRIYSGFKRKGNGFLTVECSDADSMRKFVNRLKESDNMRDKALGGRVEDLFLPDVIKEQEENQRRRRKIRELKLLRKNDLSKERLRPRRRRVVYNV